MARALAVASLVFALGVGASNAFGQSAAVRIRITPTSLTAGETVVVAVAVRPSGVRCTGALSRAQTTVKLVAKRGRGGAVSWRSKIPAMAPGGTWTARVACGNAGSATAHFSVKARPAPPPPITPAKIVVLKFGETTRRPTCSNACPAYASWGVVLQNVSPDEDALDVTLDLNFLDAKGLIIEATSQRYEIVPAGATFYAGDDETFSSTGSLPVRLEVAAVRIGWHQKKSFGGLPPVANVRTSEDAGGTLVLGDFGNLYTRTIANYVTKVTAVCFDASGNVIGGGRGSPNAPVAPGGRTGFGVSIRALSSAQIASAQVSVEPYLSG